MGRGRAALLPAVDRVLAPFVGVAGRLLRKVRELGVERMPACKAALLRVGVFPIRDHYYEPQFDVRPGKRSLAADRPLPGIDLNVDAQLELLDSMTFAEELSDMPRHRPSDVAFYLENDSFIAGDAEYWYQLIRLKKPRRIYEIGSGNSTLLAIQAIRMNQTEDPDYTCEHVCVEPFEMPWLEGTGATIVRKMVEELDTSFFATLERDDILFIDSSHVIRPQGDVLYEYLELLPNLNNGVIVHVHDVFTPRNYPEMWLVDQVRFWNEQYLLEAFLTQNDRWAVVGAVNYLRHHHFDRLLPVAPFMTDHTEPGSFYIQKRA